MALNQLTVRKYLPTLSGAICLSILLLFSYSATGQNCNCPNNLISNPSFETGDVSGWSSNVGTDFYNGTGFAVCGSKNAFLNVNTKTISNPAIFWQQVNSITPGNTYSLSINGGTHEPAQNHSFLLAFYSASGVRLGFDSVQVDYDVDINPGLKQYNLSGIAPANTSYLRIEGKGYKVGSAANGDYLKVDMACLQISCTPPTITECEARINGTWSVLSNCSVTICSKSNLELSVNPNTFTGYSQSWSGPNNYTATGNDAFISSSVTAANAGTYTVTISNGTCTATKSITVVVNSISDNIGTDQSFCGSGDPSSMGGTSATGSGAISYQWQSSTTSNACANGNGFSNLTTSKSYNPPLLSQSTYYRRIATSTLNALQCSDTNCVAINIQSKPNVGEDKTACASSTISISGSPATYTWSAQSGNPSGATLANTSGGIANVSFSGAASGTYKFIYNSSGCSDTMKITITAAPNAGTDGSTSVCNSSTAPLDLYNLITGETSGGTWSRLTGSGGTLNGSTFTPSSSTTNSTFRYVLTSGTCSDTSKVTLSVISCSCNCPVAGTNIVLNPSFESIDANSKPTSWTPAGTYNTFISGTYAVQCGNYAVQLQGTTANNASFYQSVAISGNALLKLNFFAGTHDPAGFARFGLVFYNGSTRLDSSFLEIDHYLDDVPSGSMGAYSLTATAPSNATSVRIVGKAGDKWLKVDNICLVNTGSTCTVRTNGIYFNKLDGGTDIPISNNQTFPVSLLSSGLYNIESTTTGGDDNTSVTFTISGPTASTNTENIVPYNAPGTGTEWTPSAGTYTINIKTYTAPNASGSLCHDTTITINLINCTNSAGTDGSTTVCQNIKSSINLFSLITGESSGGIWSRSSGTGGSYTAGASTFIPAGGTTSKFRYIVAASGSCPADTSFATVTINPAPTPNIITASPTACINSPVQFCSEVISGIQYYEWDFGSGSTPHTSKNKCENVSWSTSGSKTVKLYYIMLNGCYTDTISYMVTVGSGFSAGSDGSTTVCQNSKSVINLFNLITGESSGGVWSRLTGSAGTYTAGASTFTPTGGTTSKFRYIIAANGSCPADTSFATVTINPAPTPNIITASPTACINSPVQFCSELISGIQYYEWDFGSGSTPHTSKNKCENVSWSTSGTKTVKLYYIMLNGCYTDTISYTVTVGDCCNGRVTSVYFNKLDGGTDLPITNGGSYNISILSSGLYNLEAGTVNVTDGTGSIKYTITGPTASENTENSFPYNAPGGDGAWTPASGNYTVNIKVYSAQSGAGSVCHDTTITFSIIDPNCSCPNNLMTNSSFETEDVSGWSTNVGNDFYNGTGFAVCGARNAFLKVGTHTASSPALFWQQIDSVSPGNSYQLTIYGGTHEPSQNHSFLLSFYSVSGVRLLTDSVQIDYDVDVNPGLKEYTLSGTAPAGTFYLRVEGKGYKVGSATDGNYIKVDQACLQLTAVASLNLGDRVWYDQNNNGIQDVGEPGLAGATVKLYASNGTSTTQIGVSQTTTSTGLYNFTNLAPGDYIIGVTPPAGYKSSAVDGGDPDNNINTDDNGIGTGTSETKSLAITLASGTEPTNDGDGSDGNLTLDFGFAGTGTIGDFVWNDNNGNGIQDGGGETGVAGVIITLTYTINGSNFTIKDTTNAAGLYLFTDLPPANYTVVFSNIPAGKNVTVTDQTSGGGNDNNDSDGLTPPTISLTAGQNNLSIDLGLVSSASLGDFVWNDLNANGIQDAGEPGIPNVTVAISGGPTSKPNTTTNSSGKYSFTGLQPGTYTITFTTPSGYTQSSPANVSSNTMDMKDSDPVGGVVSGIILVSGQKDTTIDAGFFNLASLGDYAWVDLNRNGIQDNRKDPNGNVLGAELPMAGVIVQLFNATTNIQVGASQPTSSTGFYSFTGLMPGDYYIKVAGGIPTGYSITTLDANGNSNDAIDNDINSTTLRSVNTNLISGENDLTWDIGLKMPSNSIVDPCVWKNNATNGRDGQFTEIMDITSAPGGVWRILSQSGMYLMSSPAPPAAPIAVPIGTVIPYVSGNIYSYQFIHVDSIGYTCKVTNGTDTLMISNFCYYPDIIVNSFDTSLCITDPSVTVIRTSNQPGGVFRDTIKNLTTGQIFLTNVIDPSVLGQGNFTLKISYAAPSNLACENITYIPFNISISNCPAAIGDTVFLDNNGNGIQDAGDVGLAGITVKLYNSGGTQITQDINGATFGTAGTITTGTNGKYNFTNIAPGMYKVKFGPAPSGYVRTIPNASGNSMDLKDSDADTTAGANNGFSGVYTLAAGDVNNSVDAGYYQTASIGDYVWLDANLNGRQDLGELGIANVSVKLTNVATNQMQTMITKSNGKYMFTNLNPGTYKLTFVAPSGPTGALYGITRPNFAPDNIDSDIDFTGNTGNYTLVAGQVDTSVDAGFTVTDLQPTLTFTPASFVVNFENNFTLPIEVVCRISEVRNVQTNGSPIVVRIPRTIFANFTYNPSLPTAGGQPLNNNEWTFSQNSTYWMWTYNGTTFPAFGNSYFGFAGTFNTFTATGVYFMNVEVVNGSGGEVNFINNTDSERVDYFSN